MKRNRCLGVEWLEKRDLLAFDWLAGVGTIGAFIDGGAHLSQKDFGDSAELAGLTTRTWLTSSHAKTAAIGGSADDTNGPLRFPDGQLTSSVFVVNGGKAAAHGSALGEAGRAAIVDAVMDGMAYTGTCAGAYEIADYSDNVLNLWAGKMGYAGWGSETVSFADDAGHPIVQFLSAHGVESLTVPKIPLQGGPRFSESYRHPDGTTWVGEVIAGNAVGTPYLLEYWPANSPIVVQPGHTEYDRRIEHTILQAAILRYCADNAKVTPRVLGTLANGVPVAGVVGVEQYHRWRVDVPDGLAQMTISTSAPDGTEIYVTLNGAAYQGGADFSGDTITITAPATGTWEVSVRGTHETENGEAYTLSIEMVPGGPELDELWTIIATWATEHGISSGTLTVWLRYIGIKYADGVATAEPPPATRAEGESSRDSVFANWTPFETDETV